MKVWDILSQVNKDNVNTTCCINGSYPLSLAIQSYVIQVKIYDDTGEEELKRINHCIDMGAKVCQMPAIAHLIWHDHISASHIIYRMRPHNLYSRDWDVVLNTMHNQLSRITQDTHGARNYAEAMATLSTIGIQLLKWGAIPNVPITELHCSWQETIKHIELCRKEAATIVWCNKRNGCVLSKDMLRMIGMILYDQR